MAMLMKLTLTEIQLQQTQTQRQMVFQRGEQGIHIIVPAKSHVQKLFILAEALV